MATFDEAALSKLTAKLDSRLTDITKSDPKSSKGKRKLDQSIAATQPPAKKRTQQGKPDHAKGGKPDGKPVSKPYSKPNGKDRDLKPFAKPNGKLNAQPNDRRSRPLPQPQDKKQSSAKPSSSNPGASKLSASKPNASKLNASKPNVSKPSDANVLLDEIKALGGDEDDYKLVGDIDSDDDAINDQSKTKDADELLRAELANFAAGLGFDQVEPDPAEEETDPEDMPDEEAAAEQDDQAAGDNEDDDEDDESEETPALDPKRKTIYEPRPDWHAVGLKTLASPTSDDTASFTGAATALKDYAKTIIDEDTTAYSTTFAASSSRKFMSTIMSSGTMSDKVSALTLAVQESPVHNIKAFENLLGLGAKRSRGPALTALAALVDLLGPGMILPSDRRLRTFASQPCLIGTLQKHNTTTWSVGQALPGKITKAHLMSWYFEDWLKDSYFKMIQSLEVWCDDEVEYARTKAIDQIFALLRDKPEQESNLLRLLVNKLGDRDRKIASRASYLLLQLLTMHPRMKQVVVRSIEQDVIFRPGQNSRAKYYAVNTLNQTILSTKEPELADSLLRIYFGMFLSLLKSGELGHLDSTLDGPKQEKKGRQTRRARPSKDEDEKAKAGAGETEAAEKLVSAILTGVNRAVPFSQADQSTLESHLDTLFRITHSSNFNTSIQALMLIQQLSTNRQLATERYYRTLYESLLDPRLMTSSKQALYLNLLYRSLKADVDVRRVKAFVKRMLQIMNLHQPSFVCGIMYLAIELSVAFPDLKTLLSVPEENDVEAATPPPNSDTSPDDAAVDGAYALTASNAYDGRKRDPEYSNAHLSCLWELLPFLKHYHPSVDVYAKTLLNGEIANKKPELANHTLIAFLDKFVYKNAKATDQAKGASIMQPISGSGQSHILSSSKPSVKEAESVNSASFWNKKSGDVAVEDAFFHEYFTQMGKPGQAERESKRKAKKNAEGEGGDDEEADEDEIWDALVKSRPEIQGDSDDGAGFDDMMSLDDSDKEFRKAMEEDDDDDDDAFNLDDSDMEFSDEEIEEDGDDTEPDVAEPPSEDEKKDEKPESERKKKKRALKALPLFASAEDYAEMIAQDADKM
ncbi:putative ribosome biogenesis protein MAK21 [Rosellinia necatrix]|uniref:Putative ribosome biogenesis protein MAK21 n=1 Tax=Rosellinia necatrix TaxID=77044 RepID=A0A1S7UI36_ROSNE|nr:putative ribosome biogenesis protein MAK21 [Rosellinia necatrix]